MADSLGEYDGKPIRRTSLIIRNTGDGLSDALKVEPRVFHSGDTAFVVLEVEMTDVVHKMMDDGDAWNLAQVCKAQRGAFIDADLARPIIEGIAVAVEEMRVAEGGDVELDLDGEAAAGRLEEHARGTHKRARKDCPACQGNDAAIARVDELAARRAAHGDGEGDPDNPTPPARKRRSRAGRK